jgi:steroid 5-alpha reductase family enzyme
MLDALARTALPTLGFVGVAAIGLWAVSLLRRDASVADPAWGPGFAGVATAAALASRPLDARGVGVLVLVCAWALRLGVHLLGRNLSHGEDPRYAAMRAGWGPRFAWVSLFTVFLLQGALLWIVSLPLQAAIGRAGGGGPLGWLDGLGAALVVAGAGLEAVADAQLRAFRRDPGSRGRVLDTGVWAWSRHPNYFGDALMWWGFGCIALSTGAWQALAGPLLMHVLLVRVSGVALLERDIADRRPGYREYVARTSAFLPWPPGRRTR